MPVIYNNTRYKARTQIVVVNSPRCCEECIFHKDLDKICSITEKDTEFSSDLGFKRKEKDTREDCPLIDLYSIINIIKNEIRE